MVLLVSVIENLKKILRAALCSGMLFAGVAFLEKLETILRQKNSPF